MKMQEVKDVATFAGIVTVSGALIGVATMTGIYIGEAVGQGVVRVARSNWRKLSSLRQRKQATPEDAGENDKPVKQRRSA